MMDAHQMIEIALLLKPVHGGAYIEYNESGQPYLVWLEGDGPTPQQWDDAIAEGFDRLKGRLKASIDTAAEAERLKYITPGSGQAMTYARKVEEARMADTEINPSPADYPLLAASLGIDGPTIEDIANLVLAMDEAWTQIGAAIEAARLSAKAAIDDAADEAAAQAAADAVEWPSP